MPPTDVIAEVVSLTGFAYKPAQGLVAEWLRSGLQIRVRGFDSLRGLHNSTRCVRSLVLSGARFSVAEVPRESRCAAVQPGAETDRDAPVPAPDCRNVHRQHGQSQRHHPEAEDRQESQQAAAEQQDAETHPEHRMSRQSHVISSKPRPHAAFPLPKAPQYRSKVTELNSRATAGKNPLTGQEPLLYGPPHSPIAQLVEHSTVNRMVPGSSPGRGANLFKYLDRRAGPSLGGGYTRAL